MNTTISEQHLSKTAYVYVRQSTLAQVRHHQESTERQCCGMREKALQLGWLDGSDFDRGSGQVRSTDYGAGRFPFR